MRTPIVSLERRKTVATLNDLTDEQLEEARGWARERKAAALWFLQSLVVKCQLGCDHFIDEVLLGSADARTWGFSDILCIPDLSLNALVTRPLTASLASIDPIDGERHFRSPPKQDDRDSHTCGVPGVLVSGKPYWWAVPQGVIGLGAQPDFERIDDVIIAGRRWIASRVARTWEGTFTRTALPRTPQEVASALKLEAPLSRDGEIAIAGLIREQDISENLDRAPGFRGPDAWYAD
jgi:hypothetical protein